jgi:hypothetical protein
MQIMRPELFLSGVLPEEGSPPPSSTPDTKLLYRPSPPGDAPPQGRLNRGIFPVPRFSFALILLFP